MAKTFLFSATGNCLSDYCSTRRRAAVNESSPYRIRNCFLTFQRPSPHRSLPAGYARAWVRGGEKRCH